MMQFLEGQTFLAVSRDEVRFNLW